MRVWLAGEWRAAETRQLGITLGGYVGRFAISFAASVLLARELGPTGYGLIALVSTLFAIADALGDLGLTYAAVRGIARYLAHEPQRARDLAHGYFSLALMANTTAAVVGIALANPIAAWVLGREDAAPYFRLALVGLVVVAGNGFTAAVLQANRRFRALAAIQVLSALTYLIGMVAQVLLGRLDVTSVVLLGVVNPLVGFWLGLRAIGKGRRSQQGGWFSMRASWGLGARRGWGELIGFGKWLWGSSLLMLLATQLDLVLVSQLETAAVVGIYALAANLASKLDIVNQSRLTVLLPAASALRSRGEMRAYIERNVKLALLPAGLFLLLVPLYAPLIQLFYGSVYVEAVPPLLVLTVGAILDLSLTPFLLLGYPLNQPRALAAAEAVRVTTLLAAGLLLIPVLGMVGAALARVVARLAGAGLMLAVIAMRLRSSEPLEGMAGEPAG